MGSDSPVKPYVLTVADQWLILCSRGSNIAALYFDGQYLVDMVETERRTRQADEKRQSR